MAAISKIKINSFKAFPNDFTLTLEGKNLLMYGENGSGKSSIYYALHCILQSQCNDKGEIYFDTNSNVAESLVNKDTNKPDAFVEIKFEGSDVIYKISKSGYEESVTQPISPLRDLNGDCVFINHKFLFNVFSFRNSQYIDLFPIFIKDILPFTLTQNKSQFISQIYDDVMNGIVRHGRGRRIEPAFDKNISLFNTETKRIIDLVNTNSTNTATSLYNNYFRDKGDHKLEISLVYDDNRDKVTSPNKSYWLRYGYIYKKETTANGEPKEFKISSRVEILQPVITMQISEILSDGTSRKIEKPQTFFNEAKLTAIALSIRFSLLDLVTAPNGRFIALDDMLISLDMSNRMKVINFLLSGVGDKYKIYVFTHDALFYSSLKKRISVDKNENEWLFGGLYMHNYDIKDKELKVCLPSPMFIKETGSHLKAMEYYVKHDYPACGQILRKQSENIFDKLYPDTLKKVIDQSTGKTTNNTLNDKINKLKDFCDKNDIDYSKLKDLKIYKDNLLNTVSHYDISSPIYSDELLNIMNLLLILAKIADSIHDIKVNHELELQLEMNKGETISLCIDIQSGKIKVFSTDSGLRIIYYTPCLLKKLIKVDGSKEILENKPRYDSIYDVYEEYCEKYSIKNRANLLDIVFDHGTKLRDKNE